MTRQAKEWDRVESAAQRFGLGGIRSVRAVNPGSDKAVLHLTTARGEFGAHVFESESDAVRAEAALRAQHLLAACGAPCATPRRSPSGFLCPADGASVAVIPWVPGTRLSPVASAAAQPIARTLARIHLVSTEDAPDLPLAPFPDTRGLLDKIRRAARDNDNRRGRTDAERVERALLECPQPMPGEAGLLHGDLHSRNVIQDDSERFVAIDWFNVRHGPFVSDLGTSLLWLSRAQEFSMSAVDRFFEAYRELRTIDAELRTEALAAGYRKSLEFYAWRVLNSIRGKTHRRCVDSARRSVDSMRRLWEER